MGPSDLAPSQIRQERLDMVYSLQGLFFTVPEVYGFVGCGLVIVVHAVVGVTTRDPNTSQSPGISQGSIDGMNELLMVSSFP